MSDIFVLASLRQVEEDIERCLETTSGLPVTEATEQSVQRLRTYLKLSGILTQRAINELKEGKKP